MATASVHQFHLHDLLSYLLLLSYSPHSLSRQAGLGIDLENYVGQQLHIYFPYDISIPSHFSENIEKTTLR